MPAFVVGSIVASTVVDAVGKVKAGNAAKKVGDFNANVAEQQAEDALTRGVEKEQTFRQGVKTLIGSQRAGYAAQNVSVESGSAVDVQADAAFLGELDALQIRTNAQREAWGYRQDAENARLGGQSASASARWGAASSVAAGAASAGSMLQRYGWRG